MYTLIDEKNTYIDDTVIIGEGCIIHPGVMIKGNSIIGSGTVIYMGSYIENSTIGKNNIIYTSYIIDNILGDDNIIGPYAHLRPGNNIGNKNKLTSFAVVKNTNVGNNVRIPHLSYVGDATVEDNVNIGAGVKIANYGFDKVKNRTLIEEGAFIGCNAVLIAPVTVHKGSLVAAGSTINKDVPEKNLAIARERQTNKEL